MLLPIPLTLAAGKKMPRSFYFHTLARRSLKKRLIVCPRLINVVITLESLRNLYATDLHISWGSRRTCILGYRCSDMNLANSRTLQGHKCYCLSYIRLCLSRDERQYWLYFRQCDKPSISELTSSATSFSYHRKYFVKLSRSSAPSQLPLNNSHDVICKFLEKKSLYPWCVEIYFPHLSSRGDKRKVDLQHLDFCNMSAMLLSDRVPERQLFSAFRFRLRYHSQFCPLRHDRAPTLSDFQSNVWYPRRCLIDTVIARSKVYVR